MTPQLRLALIYLLAQPTNTNQCSHHWVKNGTRKGLQQWVCKHCHKCKSGDGSRGKGRPKRNA